MSGLRISELPVATEVSDSDVLVGNVGDPAITSRVPTHLLAAADPLARSIPEAVLPLDIGTYDANPNVTHMDVLFAPEGINGYRYVLGFTPYPDNTRENPSIRASNNLTAWELPAGCPDPIVPRSETLDAGYGYGSDADLVRLDNGDVALYYRLVSNTVKESIYRKTSSDLVTWSAATQIITNVSADTNQYLSPALVREADGTLTMFVVDGTTAGARVIRRYTSADDGLTFTGGAAVTMPTDRNPWHLDAVRVGDLHYLLVHVLSTNSSNNHLYLWRSTNGGTTFADTMSGHPFVPRTGGGTDEFGFYRSALIPRPGEMFDVLAAGMDGSSPANIFAANHRGVLFQNLTPRVDPRVRRVLDDGIWLLPEDLMPIATGPTRSVQSFRFQTYSFADGAEQSVIATARIPSHWSVAGAWPRINVDAYWTQNATATPSGDVVITAGVGAYAVGDLINTGGAYTSDVTIAAPAQHVITLTTLRSALVVDIAKNLATFAFRRRGNLAGDTFASPIHLLALHVYPVAP